ncbi:MAG: hypothetical protein V4687_15035 [Bacteroidota bacterium]
MVFYGILLFIIVSIAIGLGGALLYLLYFPIKRILIKKGKLSKQTTKKIEISYIIFLFLLSGYLTLDTIYPSEAYFREEFQKVTLRELPDSGIFISKSASYPDLHGDYCSSSQIKLSKQEYTHLLEELKKDRRLTYGGDPGGFEEFDYTLGNKSTDNIAFSFDRPVKGKDLYYCIAFYNDGETIFVNVCKT